MRRITSTSYLLGYLAIASMVWWLATYKIAPVVVSTYGAGQARLHELVMGMGR